MNNIVFSLLTLFSFNVSFAQWSAIDIATDVTLNQIYFVNNNVGFVAGNDGQLFSTTDGGDNWQQLNVGTSRDLFTISFANDNVGFINGLKTTDGGMTWSAQAASEAFGLIHALDENNLIAGLADNFSGDIYKSTDGGENWEVIANPISPLAGAYNDVCFITEEVGYLSAWYSRHLVKTIDGGNHWTEIVIDEVDGVDFSSDDFRSVDFLSEEVGLVTHQNGILKTVDAGNTWTEIRPEGLSLSFYPESIIALSTDHYILVGGFAGVEIEKIYETSDGGITWIESVITTDALLDVNCTMANCFAVGTNGKIYKQENTLNNTLESPEFSTLNIYPNPTREVLNIETTLDFTEVRILNVDGRRIDSISGKDGRIDVSYLLPGIYWMEVVSDKGVITRKIIKE